MCGIFGNFNINEANIFYDLGKYSETRGKEASGFIAVSSAKQVIKKFPVPFSNKIVRNNIFNEELFSNRVSFIGHTRLKTHGNQEVEENNQPVTCEDISVVHNGIVVNFQEIFEEFDLVPTGEVDSEVIPLLMNHFLKEYNLIDSIKNTIKNLSGEVSFAGTYQNGRNYFLYTNTGSIYYFLEHNKIKFFSSEEWITEKISLENKIKGDIQKLEPNTGIIINSENELIEKFNQECKGKEKNSILLEDIVKTFENKKIIRPVLKRCTACILPVTVPFIYFDKNGICNYCKEHKQHKIKDILNLKKLLKKQETIVVGFSGGRDSSYGLSYLKSIVKSNYVAVSYDWGMVNDLARRNQARVTGKLGVEHVWVSADISKKRKNIKKNFLAWLHKPDLGMVPILMAGDKEWQKQLFNAAKNKKTEYVVQFQSPFEHTYFKYGFAGVKPLFSSTNKIDRKSKKYFMTLQLGLYYLKNFLLNPKYLNSSIWDSLKGFFSFYFKTEKILSLYEYKPFIEDEANEYLQEKFLWECDPSTPTTWRIGDGTAPIYNYIYWIYAGFTENDFYRSNQIREGEIKREEALMKVNYENQPRFNKIKEYCDLIDVEYDFVMERLDDFKKSSIVKKWEH